MGQRKKRGCGALSLKTCLELGMMLRPPAAAWSLAAAATGRARAWDQRLSLGGGGGGRRH